MKIQSSIFLGAMLTSACVSEKPPAVPAPEYREAKLPDWAPEGAEAPEIELDDLALEWADDEESTPTAAGGAANSEETSY